MLILVASQIKLNILSDIAKVNYKATLLFTIKRGN